MSGHFDRVRFRDRDGDGAIDRDGDRYLKRNLCRFNNFNNTMTEEKVEGTILFFFFFPFLRTRSVAISSGKKIELVEVFPREI